MINDRLKSAFLSHVDFDLQERLREKASEQLPVDYFAFYNSVSSVYSSKIEGENIDFDSFFKHKFLNVEYNPDYTKRSEDLFNAYEYILQHDFTPNRIATAHSLISQHLLPPPQQGKVRNNPMYVLNEDDRIEYISCSPYRLQAELDYFYEQLSDLLDQELSAAEVFFYAAQVHLVFVKIHPFQDGNGRTARLLEKWFLVHHLGKDAVSVELEKNYYVNRRQYYDNIRALGLEYDTLDYNNALDFLLMTLSSLRSRPS